MAVPEDLAETFEPVPGTTVRLRPLRPGDVELESAFVRGLSLETRHSRLLGGARAITPEYIESLIRVDYSRDMAIAATLPQGDKEVLIGVARYVRDREGRAAEFAIVVTDAWQGRGIGRRLIEKLTAVARSRGLERLYGNVLAINQPMLGLMGRLGFRIGRAPDDATLLLATREL